MYGASKLCCIPIYSEPIQSAAVTQGATSIVASTDISYFWNIKNCDYLIIIDWVSGASEMLGVSSVSGQTISMSSAIVNSWTAATAIIYPAFAGKISSISGLDSSSVVGNVSVEFEEVSIGEEATKVWVGLDEQECPDNMVPVLLAGRFGNPTAFVTSYFYTYNGGAVFREASIVSSGRVGFGYAPFWWINEAPPWATICTGLRMFVVLSNPNVTYYSDKITSIPLTKNGFIEFAFPIPFSIYKDTSGPLTVGVISVNAVDGLSGGFADAVEFLDETTYIHVPGSKIDIDSPGIITATSSDSTKINFALFGMAF